MKLNKEIYNLGNQKKEINSIVVWLLYINVITTVIFGLPLINEIINSNNVIKPIISLIFVFGAFIGFVLMIQVKKSGLYIVFSAMTLQIIYSLFSEVADEQLIIRNFTVLIIWSCLLFLKNNGRSAWYTYLFSDSTNLNLPTKGNNTIEKDEEKSPKWLEYTVLSLAGVVVLLILYSIFIYKN